MGKLDVFMSLSPCDLGAVLSCRQCALFVGLYRGCNLLFTTANACENTFVSLRQ